MAATSAPCSGPAPPKATSEKPRGSMPFWTVRERMAFAHIRVDHAENSLRRLAKPKAEFASEAAHSSARRFHIELHDAAEEVVRASSRPRTRLASVTVGFSPPIP
jgi:hypothetical protein